MDVHADDPDPLFLVYRQTACQKSTDPKLTTRILVLGSLAWSLKNFRGAFIETLIDRGYEVHTAAPDLLADEETCAWLRQKGAAIHDVSLARTGLNPVADIGFLGQFFRLARWVKPQVFLGYTVKPVIWGILAAWLARVPQRVALVTGLGYAFTGEAHGRRAVIQRIARGLYALALRRATLVLFQNEDDRRDFQCLGILPQNMTSGIVNGSGVDTQHFADTPLPDGPVVFLLIARLLGDKGIREYVEAAKNLRADWHDAQFHLVGGIDSNPDGITNEEVTTWHDNGWVTWAGQLRDVRPAIAACHVYVLPSYREGTPRTVLEAMSMGRPIITTDAPGCRQTVDDGVNGVLVPVADAPALQTAMQSFLKDPARIKTMGQQSRRIALEKYDVHKVNASILTAIGLD
ncbi:glycosyltransferase [Rhodobacterales bacterium HKCCA1065]|nr:glycosyltransferase [Rhodobacterales bacterium HKCCA1065]